MENALFKTLRYIFAALVLLQVACATSPEKQLYDRFLALNKKDLSGLETEELKWLAMAHLKGSVQVQGQYGLAIFQAVPVAPERTFQLLEEAGRRGDSLALGLLGMLYRQGVGTERNIDKALELLAANHNGYFDLTTEYGIALYSTLDSDDADVGDEKKNKAITSIEFGAANDYLPATNWLREYYRQIEPNAGKYEEYAARSKKLAERKIAANNAFADSQRRLQQHLKLSQTAEQNFNRLMFFSMLSVGALVSLAPAQPCSAGCSPPSVQDLMNWGVL